jgi:8-oxo-dGTP diphosphatase
MGEVPRVGVGVFVIRPGGSFIIGERADPKSLGYRKKSPSILLRCHITNSYFKETFAVPGGHLELNESFEECAARELLEETGIDVPTSEFRFLTAVNTVFPESGKHYVTIFMGVKVAGDAEPQVSFFFFNEARGVIDGIQLLEPGKCKGWIWEDWPAFASLERRLFSPLIVLLNDRPGFQPENWLADVKAREMTE